MHDYNKFLSKVKRVIIPLPDFNFFHRASQDGDVDDKFVGRKNISAILENWLRVPHTANDDRNNKTADCTGSYLITGYRGMGKTSFVGKVIDKLAKEQESDWYKKRNSSNSKMKLAIKCMSPVLLLLAGCILYCVFILIRALFSFFKNPLTIPDGYGRTITIVIVCISVILTAFYLYFIITTLFKTAPTVRRGIRSILKVKINIGNEVSEIKDIFSLFAYSVKDRLNEHIRGDIY